MQNVQNDGKIPSDPRVVKHVDKPLAIYKINKFVFFCSK